MDEVTTIGVDLAKSVFQAHGATAKGEPVFRKKLSRGQFLKFLSEQPNCVVAMAACASSHYGGARSCRAMRPALRADLWKPS